MSFFNDNRDNRNNKKNGRNCGMSRGDIQLGQQDYCWQLVYFRKLKGSAAGVMKLSDAVGLICEDLSDAVGLFSKDFFDAVGEMRLFIF